MTPILQLLALERDGHDDREVVGRAICDEEGEYVTAKRSMR